jgi:hypothetical protein
MNVMEPTPLLIADKVAAVLLQTDFVAGQNRCRWAGKWFPGDGFPRAPAGTWNLLNYEKSTALHFGNTTL